MKSGSELKKMEKLIELCKRGVPFIVVCLRKLNYPKVLK